MRRRIIALIALVCAGLGIALLVAEVVANFGHATWFVVFVASATAFGWIGLTRTGWVRVVSWTAAVVSLAVAISVLLASDFELFGTGALLLLVVSLTLSKTAFSIRSRLPAVPAPRHPVMLYNPRSGNGVAGRVNLVSEARARGIEPLELVPGTDLRALLADAIGRGADGLMAAGGDGTQALVASVAAAHDLPFACVPAGTRNHFALDVGVDRTDVIGALEAFVDGGEKRVDLAEVNGEIFVNNVSMGVYAEAVRQPTYRSAKIRTLLRTLASALPSSGTGSAANLTWVDPDGSRETSAAVILVANNVYRLGNVIGSGTRPRLDAGVLGITVVGAEKASGRRVMRTNWAAPDFEVTSDSDVPIGLDGESRTLPAPLRFASRPGALRIRIAPHHPGVSPSAGHPDGSIDGLRQLLRLAIGRHE